MKAVQSAMAIRRQRHRREEQRRAKARRYSHTSDHYMLSPTGSFGSVISLDGKARAQQRQVLSTVTTFHVGIVFLFMGLMLVISGLVPGYTNRDWQELIGIGSFLFCVGIILIIVNRIASSKEDEKFNSYISRKLAPAKIHQPVATLSANDHHVDTPDADDHINQLEAIDEEMEVTSSSNPDQVYWTNEVAPVHRSHQSHQSHPQHASHN